MADPAGDLGDVSSWAMVWEARPMVPHTMVLAHQGGWDEMLFVATPVVIFVVLLRVANSRAAAQVDQDGDVDDDPGSVDPDADG